MKKILDSGTRREFESGAVRDIQEGKGRCDLLPLDTIAHIYAMATDADDARRIFFALNNFTKTGDIYYLVNALDIFPAFGNTWSGMFLEVSKHFEEGAKKYSENNWQKGIPVRCYIDSAVRHYLKWLREDDDEPHDRAFVWNLLCCIWTCQNKPELNDYFVQNNDESEE